MHKNHITPKIKREEARKPSAVIRTSISLPRELLAQGRSYAMSHGIPWSRVVAEGLRWRIAQ